MKKFALMCLVLILLGGHSWAETNGSVALSGFVASKMSMTLVNTPTNLTSLDLTVSQSALSLGSVNFIANRKSWYVRVYSTNGSRMVNGTDFISYTFTITDATMFPSIQGVTLGAGLANAVTQTMTKNTAMNGDLYGMTMSYTGRSDLAFGTFTDTITIVITAT